METIERTDISELTEFKYDGDTLTKEKCLDEAKHIYLFARYNKKGRLFAYELVKGVKHKNPDGGEVYTYPATSQFGRYAYFIAKRWAETDIPKYLQILQERGKNL